MNSKIIKPLTLLGIILTSSLLTPIANAQQHVQSDISQYVYKELPRVPVNLNKLPVKYPGKAPFADAQASQYKNYINWAYNVGITTGYTPTSYKPNYSVTRGEMAVFLHRLAGTPSYNPPFNVYTDVTQYKNQILWLTATTVSNGTAPHYNPNGNVTRGQMAAFLHRMAKVSGKAPANGKYGSPFKDISGNMFQNDIGWLYSQGITTGYTPITYNPNGSVTRGEMAAFLYRFHNTVITNNPPKPQGKYTVWYNGDTTTKYNIKKGDKLFSTRDQAQTWISDYARKVMIDHGETAHDYGTATWGD